MESRRENNVEYKRFSIQGKVGKEISGLICQSIHH